MKKVLATLGLFALLAIPTTMANAACCNSCDSCCAPAPCCAPACAAPCCDTACDACPNCKVQTVCIPKKHFWNLKRTGYYVVCPCDNCTGCAACVCPTKIGECISGCTPSKMVVIPKRHFWEHDRCQRMPIVNNCCDCCKPACGCCK